MFFFFKTPPLAPKIPPSPTLPPPTTSSLQAFGGAQPSTSAKPIFERLQSVAMIDLAMKAYFANLDAQLAPLMVWLQQMDHKFLPPPQQPQHPPLQF